MKSNRFLEASSILAREKIGPDCSPEIVYESDNQGLYSIVDPFGFRFIRAWYDQSGEVMADIVLTVLPTTGTINADEDLIAFVGEEEVKNHGDKHREWQEATAAWAEGKESELSFSPEGQRGRDINAQRRIWVRSFQGWAMENFIRQITYMSEENSVDPITVMISSTGGSVFSMFAMVNAAEMVEAPIRTVVVDVAMSSGAFMLAMAGEEGMRYTFPDATMMIHGASAMTWGTIPDMKNDVKFYEDLEKRVFEKMATRTLPDAKEWIDMIYGNKKDAPKGAREFFLNPEKALELGVIDEVLDKKSFNDVISGRFLM